MNADVEVLVVSTPEEMSRAGESTHVLLERSVEFSLPPFVGLRFGLKPNLEPGDRRLIRYSELMREVSDNTAIFEIEALTDFPGSRLVARAKEKYEPKAEKFRGYIELLTTFYGFQRSTKATSRRRLTSSLERELC
jgi:hypothetical protein